MKKTLLSVAVLSAVSTGAYALDFGQKVELLAKAQSLQLFGVVQPLGASSGASVSAATANATPTSLVTVAPGLTATVVSADASLGANVDMMAMWPDDAAPTHLIVCNEQGSTNVAVQRVEIATGIVQNIISSGLTSCDPAHRTPWGTVIVAEEAGANGRMFEILDPLTTTGVTVSGTLGSTTTSDPTKVAYRPAVGALSFEGVALFPNGVMYYGDEKRPGSGNPGGSYFKFIPTTPWAGGPAITNLTNSPLVSGNIYGMRTGKRSGNTDYGHGNEFGRGIWVSVTGAAPINLGAAAVSLKLPAYYRPEDLAIDQKVLASGNVRVCGNNTGEDGVDNHWGETFCITDGTLAQATSIVTLSTPEYQPLVLGNVDFAMMDNIAYQPVKGNWLIQEDGEGPSFGRNNDIWSCTEDGLDKDILSDACAKVVTLNDLTAESTGGVFTASGTTYYMSVQHNITGHGVILKITGWQ